MTGRKPPRRGNITCLTVSSTIRFRMTRNAARDLLAQLDEEGSRAGSGSAGPNSRGGFSVGSPSLSFWLTFWYDK